MSALHSEPWTRMLAFNKKSKRTAITVEAFAADSVLPRRALNARPRA